MPGEKEIRAACRESVHRHLCSANQIASVMTFRQIKRMMSNDRFHHLVFEGAEQSTDPLDLIAVDATTLHGKRTSGVDSDNDHFLIRINRLEIVGNVAAVFSQRLKKAREDIMQRHIVISGHHNLRLRQSVEERARLTKLV